jgi:hypothetical protein
MAYENVALEPVAHERDAWPLADEFVFGRPATRIEIIRYEIVSFFELFRMPRDEDAEPLGIAFVKLAMLVIVGIAATTAAAYALGTVAARTFSSFVG